MNYTTLKDSVYKLINKEDFAGNSFWAEHNTTWQKKGYYVFSYATIIGAVVNGVYYINDSKYSSTTSRQQNQLRKAWSNCNAQELPWDTLEKKLGFINVTRCYAERHIKPWPQEY